MMCLNYEYKFMGEYFILNLPVHYHIIKSNVTEGFVVLVILFTASLKERH
jgi:hypothetical protein